MNQIIEVKPISPKEIEKHTREILKNTDIAEKIVISTQAEYEKAALFLQDIKKISKNLEIERKKITGPIDAAKSAVQALFKHPQNLAAKVEDIIKYKMVAYVAEQEKKQKEEQERLEKIAEKERAEKERQEREWREKEEAKRREAERLAKEGREKEAQKALDAANKASLKAQERSIQAENIVAPIASPKIEKVSGVMYREDWYAEVVDFSALPDEFKMADMQRLNKIARATKNERSIPGVVFKSNKTAVVK